MLGQGQGQGQPLLPTDLLPAVLHCSPWVPRPLLPSPQRALHLHTVSSLRFWNGGSEGLLAGTLRSAEPAGCPQSPIRPLSPSFSILLTTLEGRYIVRLTVQMGKLRLRREITSSGPWAVAAGAQCVGRSTSCSSKDANCCSRNGKLSAERTRWSRISF